MRVPCTEECISNFHHERERQKSQQKCFTLSLLSLNLKLLRRCRKCTTTRIERPGICLESEIRCFFWRKTKLTIIMSFEKDWAVRLINTPSTSKWQQITRRPRPWCFCSFTCAKVLTPNFQFHIMSVTEVYCNRSFQLLHLLSEVWDVSKSIDTTPVTAGGSVSVTNLNCRGTRWIYINTVAVHIDQLLLFLERYSEDYLLTPFPSFSWRKLRLSLILDFRGTWSPEVWLEVYRESISSIVLATGFIRLVD